MDVLLAKLKETPLNELDLQKFLKEGSELSANNDYWTELAKIAIKKRDFDVTLFCITKMKMARAARDARNLLTTSKTQDEALACLSINLGLVDEAVIIIKESGDDEALCRIYQEMNNWSEALETSNQMNLPTVYYCYAKKLELDGKFSQAIKYYELSNTHTFEVPRMLYNMDSNNTSLRAYCNKELNENNDSTNINSQIQLYKWWAQFCESIGEMEEAASAYTKANDYYNLVRLLSFTDQIEKARTFVESLMNQSFEANSRERRSLDAALLFLGKEQESTNPSVSVAYFLACGAIKHALKACKNAGMINEMVKIIVTYGSKDDAKALINKYLRNEETSEISATSMIRLFHKCGATNKAIKKAIESRNWTQLREIIAEEAENSTKSDERIITESVIEDALSALRNDSEIVDIVIDLILLSKNSKEFLLENIIEEYNVQVDDSLIDRVEKLTSSRGSNDKLISSLADLSLKQGKYLIAAKLFNSTGDRMNSIKALIRSGDTEKVIKYANIARNKGVYKITANYLQTVDYYDRQLVANFYKKASANDELKRYQQQQQQQQ